MFFLIIIFLLGISIGSFINCFLYRLKNKINLSKRSFCPKCKSKIYFFDNIPLFSYLFLKAKCRHCKQKISSSYFFIEFSTGVLFILAWINIFGVNLAISQINKDFFLSSDFILFIRNIFIVSVFVVIFIYDLRWYLILDRVTIPAFFIILIFNFFLGISLNNLFWGIFIGGGFFLLQFILSRGRWIGGGDIRLGTLIGLIFSLNIYSIKFVISSLFLAYFLGAIVGIFLILINKKSRKDQVPFGPFLVISTISNLFWGEIMISYYLDLFH